MVDDWKSIVVTPEATIRETLKVIDSSGIQIALVLDDKGCLVGTVTDGDIRRALLADAELDQPINSFVFRTPVSAKMGESREELHRLMRKNYIRQIPLLDEQDRVVGLELLPEAFVVKPLDAPVVIMAGGLGTRLRPLTNDCPKPMLRVGGRPVLETILTNFKEQGFYNFFISVNYMSKVIEEFFGDGSKLGVHIEYLREDKRMGTAGAIGLMPTRPEVPFILVNGDVLTTLDYRGLLNFHVEKKAQATVCLRSYEHQVPYGVVTVENDKLVNIVEKPVQRHFVNAGIYVLNPSVLSYLPHDEYCDMTDLLPRLQDAGSDVCVYPISEYWLDIGRMADLERAECDFGEIFE